jgi:hypothetical protein
MNDDFPQWILDRVRSELVPPERLNEREKGKIKVMVERSHALDPESVRSGVYVWNFQCVHIRGGSFKMVYGEVGIDHPEDKPRRFSALIHDESESRR